jgi:hypothetical protein
LYVLLFIVYCKIQARSAAYSYDQDWSTYNGHSSIEKLTDDGGVDYVKRQKAVLLFFYSKSELDYITWDSWGYILMGLLVTDCSYCDSMKPEIAATAAALSSKGSSIKVAAVEGAVYPAVRKYRFSFNNDYS